MKKFLLITVMTAMLLSCKENSDFTIYQGDYFVDNNTVIILNGQEVNLSDYENAEINIAVIEGNSCNVTLRNFINGQPEVIIPATISEGGTKSAAGATFSGSEGTIDRLVTIEGATAEASISSITITEEVTVDGIAGRWLLNGATFDFSHPDLQQIDFSEISPDLVFNVDDIVGMLNSSLGELLEANNYFQESYLEFTTYGTVNFQDADPLINDIICYYVRPEESTLYVYLRKTLVDSLFTIIREEPDMMNVVSMLGFTSLVENPQSMSIPLDYVTGSGTLTLSATQDILDPYEAQLEQPIGMINAILQTLTYESFSQLLADYPDLLQLITAENFPRFKEIILNTFNTLTDGQAEYSLSLDFIPYAG